MKKREKNGVVFIIAMIVMSGFIVLLTQGCNLLRESEESEMEQEKSAEEIIIGTYRRLNFAFLITDGLNSATIYKEFHEASEYSGVHWQSFLRLRLYENRTGVYLSYEKVVDYFSEEFEPDGTLRLYNNGNHPEIEAYVKWFNDEVSDWRRESGDFFNEIMNIYFDYIRAYQEQHEQEGITFTFRRLRDLSPEMLSAIARKEADPDYELDLIGLQKQGYGIIVENPHWEMD